jgi:hypothetical protein
VVDNDKLTKWDVDLKGAEMGKIVFGEKQENWGVSSPKFGERAKDISDAIVVDGWLSTYDSIMKNTKYWTHKNNGTDFTTDLVLKTKFKSLSSAFGPKKRKTT